MSFIEKILLKLFRHVDVEKVVNGEKNIYMRRFFILERDSFKLYLHNIRRSDDDPDPHDHPWDFTTLVLKGGYVDESYVPVYDWKHSNFPVGAVLDKVDRLGFLSVRRRKAEHVHQVKLIDKKPMWSLVLLGKYRREWGFLTQNGWVMWRRYLNFWGYDIFDNRNPNDQSSLPFDPLSPSED